MKQKAIEIVENAQKSVDGEHAFHLKLLRIGLSAAIIENLRIDFDRQLFDECKNHDYDYKNEYMNLYGFCYGDDLGEVVFDFHQPKKENLLIIDSTSLIFANKNCSLATASPCFALVKSFKLSSWVSFGKLSVQMPHITTLLAIKTSFLCK